MNIAFLILAHTDPEHITRLSNRLSNYKNFDIYIHVDKKINIEAYKRKLDDNNQVFFIKKRKKVSWGAYSSIDATIELLKSSFCKNKYDRYVLLQGLDYPLKSNEEIDNFFAENSSTEFIRACKISGSKNNYHFRKFGYYWFFENKNFFKKIINNLNKKMPFKIRRGYIDLEKRYEIYWGAAQWALTNECIKYILNFEATSSKFNKYFKFVFPQDETYFHTIIYNSIFKGKTYYQKEEPEKIYLENWRNLHYFEYPRDSEVKIFDFTDYCKLIKKDSLFIRKVTTKQSTELLDALDALIFNKKSKL